MNHPLQPCPAFTLNPDEAGQVRRWCVQTATGLQSGWWRAGASPSATDWLVLHGGPGSGASPSLLAPFTSMDVNVWAPNQRACLPLPERVSSPLNVQRMVQDLEALRQTCGVVRWSVLAGSWGAYLALAYLDKYPDAVERLVLRGSFLGGRADIWSLVQCLPSSLQCSLGLAKPRSVGALASWLSRAAYVYQYGAHGTSRKNLAHAWVQAEIRLALHGARRAQRAMTRDVAMRAQQQALVRGLCASLRRSTAASRMGKPVAKSLARKVAIQLRLLPSLLAKPVLRAAQPFQRWAQPRLALVHGQFDAVCQPRQSRQLMRSAQHAAGLSAQVSIHACQAGHLGHEPAIGQALTMCVFEGDAR